MNNNVVTYNANGNAIEEKDVKFTLPLSADLNRQVEEKAKQLGLKKIPYIRMILSQIVNE